MSVLWDIVAAVGHAIEQVILYVETHPGFSDFWRPDIYFTCMTKAFTPASMLSTDGSMKSGSVSPSNIDRQGGPSRF